MKIPMMQAIKNFKVVAKSKTNPAHAARALAAKNRLMKCFELIKSGEINMSVLCNKLSVCRAVLIRYLNELATKKLIKVRCVKGCKYKILGTL